MRLAIALTAPLLLAWQQPAPVRLEGAPVQGALVRGEAEAGVAALTLRVPDEADVPVVLSDGRFVIGFDRDAAPDAALVARRRDGSEQVLPLTVAARAWPIQRIDADPFGGAGGAFAVRRPAELARIAAARAWSDPALTGWTERMRWPAIGRRAAPFGVGRVYRGTPGGIHAGTDIAAPTGTPVIAPAGGRVVLAATPGAPFTLEGNLLIVDHGAGLTSAFLHLSRIDVVDGQVVAAGQTLGAVGRTGRATGPHLHWALQWRGRRVDPATVIEEP